MIKSLTNIEKRVNKVMAAAELIYGEFDVDNIRIVVKPELDTVGKCILGGRRTAFYFKQENPRDNDIIHEVAHLVAFLHKDLGAKRHNQQWFDIYLRLGGS